MLYAKANNRFTRNDTKALTEAAADDVRDDGSRPLLALFDDGVASVGDRASHQTLEWRVNLIKSL